MSQGLASKRDRLAAAIFYLPCRQRSSIRPLARRRGRLSEECFI